MVKMKIGDKIKVVGTLFGRSVGASTTGRGEIECFSTRNSPNTKCCYVKLTNGCHYYYEFGNLELLGIEKCKICGNKLIIFIKCFICEEEDICFNCSKKVKTSLFLNKHVCLNCYNDLSIIYDDYVDIEEKFLKRVNKLKEIRRG